MEEKSILIIIIVVSTLLLGVSFFMNVNDTLSFIADPLYGEGFGNLCSSPSECQEFCEDNRGRCNEYCQENSINPLCDDLFGGLN